MVLSSFPFALGKAKSKQSAAGDLDAGWHAAQVSPCSSSTCPQALAHMLPSEAELLGEKMGVASGAGGRTLRSQLCSQRP